MQQRSVTVTWRQTRGIFLTPEERLFFSGLVLTAVGVHLASPAQVKRKFTYLVTFTTEFLLCFAAESQSVLSSFILCYLF